MNHGQPHKRPRSLGGSDAVMEGHTQVADGDGMREGVDLKGHATTTRRLVMSLRGTQIANEGADPDDVMQDVYVRILTADRSERSRWDPTRGMSRTTYLAQIGKNAAANSLRDRRRHTSREQSYGLRLGIDDDTDGYVEADDLAAPPGGSDLGPAMDRILGQLDTDDEKQMAMHLAAGCSLADTQRRMGLGYDAATELRTRVRALLLSMRED